MKNYILVFICLFASMGIYAQKEKIVGNWVETYQIYLDTLDSGIELFNSDAQAYLKGSKTLPAEHVRVVNLFDVYDGHYSDRKRSLKIDNEKNFLRAILSDGIDEKISYNAKSKNYLVSFPNTTYLASLNNGMIVRFNETTKTLQFVKPISVNEETLVYEFVREK